MNFVFGFFKLLVLSIKGTQGLIMKVTLYAYLNRQTFCLVRCGRGNMCALLEFMNYILKWDLRGFYSKDKIIIA